MNEKAFGFFFRLALNEVDDVRMVDIQDDHLGGAASLAAGLDNTCESIEATHEAERAGSCAAATRQQFRRSAQGRKVSAGA
jgi:hypothetical protein